MQIPLVDLAAQYENLKSEIDAAISGVISSSGFILGKEVAAFESRFSSSVGAQYVCGVSSGTEALHMAIRSLDIGPEDEVITVVNTWISTAFAISYLGATPVFVDIDPDTYQMDPMALEKAITPKTKAVIPVHMYGHPAPMTEIMEICRPRGIRVIEDTAQAPMATVDGQIVGTIGDIGCFSFYPSKNLGCYGDAGATVTNDAQIMEKIRVFARYGQTSAHFHTEIGHNARMDTIQAAILLVKLGYLEQWTSRRREIAQLYNEKLAKLPVIVPGKAQNAQSVHHIYPIQVDNRDAILKELLANGVQAQVHYPTPVHLQPCYSHLEYEIGSFPIAEQFMSRTLSLPIYPELTERQVSFVVDALSNAISRCSPSLAETPA